MLEDSVGAGGQSSAGEAPSIGLSHVHIPSRGVNCEAAKGKFRDIEEGRICNGPAFIPYKHPCGPGEVSNGDRIYTLRRWRDGISVGDLPVLDTRERPARGEVREFTKSSRARMVRFLRECEADYKFMGTLTVGAQYSRDPVDFRCAVDRWLVAAMRELKRARARAGRDPEDASIFWWVEFQSRGAPHLHLYYTDFVQWKALALRWESLCGRFNLCGSSEIGSFWKTSTKFEKIKAGFRGMISYARKYAQKEEQKQEVEGVLDGGWRGRYWGVRGNRRRGSCHVQILSRHPGARAFSSLRAWLDELVAAKKLGRVEWEYGNGSVYYLKGGVQWTDTRIGAELELRLSNIILSGWETTCQSSA